MLSPNFDNPPPFSKANSSSMSLRMHFHKTAANTKSCSGFPKPMDSQSFTGQTPLRRSSPNLFEHRQGHQSPERSDAFLVDGEAGISILLSWFLRSTLLLWDPSASSLRSVDSRVCARCRMGIYLLTPINLVSFSWRQGLSLLYLWILQYLSQVQTHSNCLNNSLGIKWRSFTNTMFSVEPGLST